MINIRQLEQITYRQISDLKHAIGFDNHNVKGTKHRTYKPYRNYFFAGESDKANWNQLVELGLAEEFQPNYYCVTEDGKEFLRLVTGVKITEDLC